MSTARNPAIYIDVDFDRGPTIVDGKLVQRITQRKRRDTAKEKSCDEDRCLKAHARALNNPGFYKNGKPKSEECGHDCHMELS